MLIHNYDRRATRLPESINGIVDKCIGFKCYRRNVTEQRTDVIAWVSSSKVEKREISDKSVLRTTLALLSPISSEEPLRPPVSQSESKAH